MPLSKASSPTQRSRDRCLSSTLANSVCRLRFLPSDRTGDADLPARQVDLPSYDSRPRISRYPMSKFRFGVATSRFMGGDRGACDPAPRVDWGSGTHSSVVGQATDVTTNWLRRKTVAQAGAWRRPHHFCACAVAPGRCRYLSQLPGSGASAVGTFSTLVVTFSASRFPASVSVDFRPKSLQTALSYSTTVPPLLLITTFAAGITFARHESRILTEATSSRRELRQNRPDPDREQRRLRQDH